MWEMRCGKISKKLLRLISLTCLFILRHGQKLCEDIFSYVWHNSFLFFLTFVRQMKQIFFCHLIFSFQAFLHFGTFMNVRGKTHALSHILTNIINFFTIIIFQLERIASRTSFSYILSERFKYILFVLFSTEILTAKMFYDSMMVRLWQLVRCVINDQPRFVTSIVIHYSRENVPF